MHHPTDRIKHTTAFVTPVVEHWLEREIAQWVHPMKDRSDDPSHHERTLYLWATSRSLCDWKEGNVLFNDARNTFYLRLSSVRHMVKDHSDSEKGNPLPPHRLLFTINSQGSFICTIPQTGLHISRPCYTSRGALAGTRKSSMGSPHEGSIRRPISPWANALTTELHLALVMWLFYFVPEWDLCLGLCFVRLLLWVVFLLLLLLFSLFLCSFWLFCFLFVVFVCYRFLFALCVGFSLLDGIH